MAFRVLATNVDKRGMIEQEVVESTQKTMNSPPTHPRPSMQGRDHEDGGHTDQADRISGFPEQDTQESKDEEAAVAESRSLAVMEAGERRGRHEGLEAGARNEALESEGGRKRRKRM
jgi:hypothetical protein